MLFSTILAALIPIAAEGTKQLISKWTGGVRATTVEEQIKLDDAEVKRLQAIAALDTPIGAPSQWVVDLRASARYIGALAVIAVGIGSLYVVGITPTVQAVALEAANIAFGFLFGSRIVSNWKPK